MTARVFTDPADAEAYVREIGVPMVVAAVGLVPAAKGAIVARNEEEGLRAVREMMVERLFGAAGRVVAIERYDEFVDRPR